MRTVTLRIPDSKHKRLKQYSKEQGISLNKLFDEFATVALVYSLMQKLDLSYKLPKVMSREE